MNPQTIIALNIFFLISMADAVQQWDPDTDIAALPKQERDILREAGEATPLGTRSTAEDIEKVLTQRPIRFPSTIEGIQSIRDLTPLEISLILLSMQSPQDGWMLYTTDSDVVPYMLSNGKGDYISPVEVYDEETGETDILFATPKDRIIDGAVINSIFSGMIDTNAESKEELYELYPDITEYIDRAFKPGAPVIDIIKQARDSGAYSLAAIGDEVPLITSIMRIKSKFGANRILYA